MEILDRTKQPEIKSIGKIDMMRPQEYKLDNGIRCFAFNASTQDVVKIQFTFYAGGWHQNDALTAFSTNKMLIEGTRKYTAEEIALSIDYYGACIEQQAEKDMAYISLYTLNKYLKNTIPILEEIIKQPTFPDNELSVFLRNQKQNFLVNAEKVNFIARTKFNEYLFGVTHPYGKNVAAKDFDQLSNNKLKKFYSQYYHASNCFIVISGSVTPQTIKTINNYFGGDDWKQTMKKEKINTPIISTSKRHQHIIVKEKAIQSSIRIGKILFNKTHEDFHGLLVLNTLLGGYFGSRLMTNIREDKGYTYGINSAIVSLHHSGYFFIATEVGVDVCTKAIEEIFREIKKIRTEKVKSVELDTVINYMLGNFLRSIDGPFAISEKFSSIYEYGMDYEYYENFIKTIKTIKPIRIIELAEKYLHEDSMINLVVGKMKN